MATEKNKNYLKQLVEFFPTAVYTGQKLVFVSKDWNVEVVEYTERVYCNLGEEKPTIRVNVYKITDDNSRCLQHSEDFTLTDCCELAAEIEKYMQRSIHKAIKEK